MRLILSALLCLWPASAAADPPRVLADIGPVHALVASVTGQNTVPGLLVAGGSDPHQMQLRPSQARALARADIVFWVGPALAPWLEAPLETLAPGARRIALLDQLPAPRRGADASPDPHAWLDPRNAAVWLDAIAETLAGADPENASTYRANATAGRQDMLALEAELRALLAPARGRRFVTWHGAFGYFAEAFGLEVAATVTDTDAVPPGPARLREIRALLGSGDIDCLVLEPETHRALAESLTRGTRVRRVTLDPLGRDLPAGPDLLAALLRRIAAGLAECASGRGPGRQDGLSLPSPP